MTAKTKSERLRRLTSNGFFAPELPPCFVSNDLAKFRKYICDTVEDLPTSQGKPAFHRYQSEPTWFYFPRYGKNDRKHGILNPISFLMIAKVLADHYVDLRGKAKESKLSASPLIFDWGGSRALARSSIDLRDDFRIDLATRSEEYIVADIRAFFHSIYTHSIPWAIYGKTWSKTNRSVQHYGNLIDLLCRNSQDGQTIGLPVGPDTSRLISEILASAIDTLLQKKLNIESRDASRYIDDYTISSPHGESAESLFAILRQSIGHFELELNNDKSGIHQTSTRQIVGWKQAIRTLIPSGAINHSKVQHFLYEVGRICELHPDLNVEKFALQNARLALIKSTECLKTAHSWQKVAQNTRRL